MRIQLHPARLDDAVALWRLANEPQLRAMSFCEQPISWEDHLRWFEAKLADAQCLFLIAENDAGAAIAQVRFDMKDQDATISLGVEAEQRGKGFGSVIVSQASHLLFEKTEVNVIHAYLKPINMASRRVFEKSGYENVGVVPVKRQDSLHYILQRGSRL
jgi:UDP-2,4-diacetamido-2,4,6-trideoxy-beta-L-altropyranose hydrolase